MLFLKPFYNRKNTQLFKDLKTYKSMEHSAETRLTEKEITELSDIFLKIYEEGAYDPEEGDKTPAQRKQVKCQFKKTITKDNKSLSKYYMCLFRTVLEADLDEMRKLRRHIKDIKRQQETMEKNLQYRKDVMKDDVRKEVRDELTETHFKEQAEQNKRLKKLVNDLNERIIRVNKENADIKEEMRKSVPRKEYRELQKDYYALLELKNKKTPKEKTVEDKEREKKRKELEELQKKRKQMEEDEAKILAELECETSDEPEEIIHSFSSEEEE